MLSLTQQFIKACDGHHNKVTGQLQPLQLDYFKLSAIKRDIIDNGYLQKYQEHYPTLCTLLNNYREKEIKQQIAELEDIIRSLPWEEKKKACEEKLQELHNLWKSSLPVHFNNMLSVNIKSSKWIKKEAYPQEKISELYEHWQGLFSDQNSLPQNERWHEVELMENEKLHYDNYEWDPSVLYSMLARIVVKKLNNIQEAIICQEKNLDYVVLQNFRYFTYEEFTEKLEKELARLPAGKQKPYLIKLKGTIEALPYSDLMLKVLKVNETGEWENKDDIIHQNMFTGYIDYLLEDPKLIKNNLKRNENSNIIKLTYTGTPQELISGFTYYNNIHWLISDVEAFVYTYFRFMPEHKIEVNNSNLPTYQTLKDKHTLTDVIKQLEKKIVNGPADKTNWLLQHIDSTKSSIRNYFNSNAIEKNITRNKVDINLFR